MTMAEAVVKRIDNLLKQKGWTQYRLSKDGCIPKSTLTNLTNGHTKSPTLVLIYRLADAFGMTYLEFLDDDIFRSPELEWE